MLYKEAGMRRETSLADKVRVKRAEMRLSQAELAKRAGLTQATISRIEAGELKQLRSEKLSGLAKALRVTVDFLVGKSERMEFDETLLADETAKTIFRGYEKLPETKRQQLKEFVAYLLSTRKDSE
jgi:transcriptional regulator with XRE-family HTH domain